MASNMKLPPEPPQSGQNYRLWRKDVELWKKLTDTPKRKMGVALQYSCRTNQKIHEAILNIPEAQVDCDDGIDNVLKELDKLHNVNEKENAVKNYEEFLAMKRKPNQKIPEFMNEFQMIADKTKANGNNLSDDLLAFRLLQALDLPEVEIRIIKSSIAELTVKNIKDLLEKSYGESFYNTSEIKPEPIFQSSVKMCSCSKNHQPSTDSDSENDETTLYAGNWRKRKNKPNDVKKQDFNQSFQFSIKQPLKRGKNPLDKQGNITQCHNCYSINHWADACPDSHEDGSNQTLYNITLFEDDEQPHNLRSLVIETIGCAVLDCGAARTVCGKTWLQTYMELLTDKEKKEMKESNTCNVFKFGSGKRVKSEKCIHLPITLGNKKVNLITEVVDEDIPLLFSRMSMTRAKSKLNTEDETVTLLGQKIKMILTSTGHFAIPIHTNRHVIETEAKINLFTSTQNMSKDMIARKLHQQFAHPPAERLIRLIKKSDYDNKELNEKIKDISANCTICMKYKKTPPRPVVAMPMATRFNQTIAMDLKFINNIPILHMIDTLTRFSVSTVVKSKEPKYIIGAIFKHWVTIFGPPGKILTDNGGEFSNQEFISLCEAFNIIVTTTSAQSPWSNGLCERYNGVLGEMVNKILEDCNCSLEIAVAWATSAKNCLETLHGFSPAQLVFGFNPMLPSILNNKPPALSSEEAYSQIIEENMKAMKNARLAFIKSESSERIKRALSHNIRASGNVKYVNGDRVFYKRKDEREWHGPGTVIGQDGQFVLVRNQSSWVRVHPCRLQLIPPSEITHEVPQEKSDKDMETVRRELSEIHEELSPTIFQDDEDALTSAENDITEEVVEIEDPGSSSVNIDSDMADGHAENSEDQKDENEEKDEDMKHLKRNDGVKVMKDLVKGSDVQFKLNDSDIWTTGQLHSRSGKTTGKYCNEWNVTVNNQNKVIDFDRMVTEIQVLNKENETIDEQDDEILMMQDFQVYVNEQVTQAKCKELDNWKSRNVYTEVENTGQKLITVKWVVTPKIINNKPDVKARLVARGFEEESNIRRDSPTCSKQSVRMCLMITATNEWDLKSLDIKAAFLQSDGISRQIYIKPPKEAKTKSVWLLNRTVYGLRDASREWYKKVYSVLTKLGCESITSDPAVFYLWSDGILQGMITCYVDDMLHSGTKLFQRTVIEGLRDQVTVGTDHDQIFKYIGINLVQNSNKSICLDQIEYGNKLEEIKIEEIKTENVTCNPGKTCKLCITCRVRSLIGKLNWITGISRPDKAFQTCQISTKVNKVTLQDVEILNKVVRDIRNHPLTLVFHKLSLSDIHLVLYTDAAYGNLHDGGSQGGYLVFISDGIYATPLDWSSHRLKRVSRSTLSAETQALLDGIDAATYYAHTIEEVMHLGKVKIYALTDSKSLVDNAKTSNVTDEKRLRIEMAAVREFIEREEVILSWIDTKSQLADCLTKEGASPKLLRRVLKEGRLSVLQK